MIRLLLIAALLAFQSVTVPTPATAQTQTGNDYFASATPSGVHRRSSKRMHNVRATSLEL